MKPLNRRLWCGRTLGRSPLANSGRTLGLLLVCGFAILARPATNEVTTLADNGGGSLRQVIANAASGDFILFGVTGTIVLTNGELAISNDLNIVGPGSSTLAISSYYSSRILRINANTTVAISGLTIQDGESAPGAGGNSGQSGGGILNEGVLSVSNCIISGNTTGSGGLNGGAGGNGGAIFNSGTLTLTTSVIGYNWVSSGGMGGGLYNTGVCIVSGCTFAGNSTSTGIDGSPGYFATAGGNGGDGGAIYSQNAITLLNCTLTNNSCGSGGTGGAGTPFAGDGGMGGNGGAICANGDLTMTGCTVADNRAGMGGTGGYSTNRVGWGGHGGSGGGILSGDFFHAGATGILRVTNCTFAANVAGNGGFDPFQTAGGGSGGAIYSACSNHFIVACTIVSNSIGFGANNGPEGIGGGINVNSASAMYLLDSLVAGNTGPRPGHSGIGPDICGTFHSLGYNLIGATNGYYADGTNGFLPLQDWVGSTNSPLDPKVGPLADNGGPTLTMALRVGSPAIDTGSAVGAPAADQRGIRRPQGAGVDIGAFEYQYSPVFTLAKIQNVTNCLLKVGGLLPHQVFSLMVSSNFAAWSALTNLIADTNGVAQFVEPFSRSSRLRLYRVKLGAP